MLGQLQVQRRKIAVQAERHAVFNRRVVRVGIAIGHRQFVDAPEGQIGLEPQHGVGMGVQQRVADQQLVAADHEEQFLAEEHSAYPVGDHRIGIHFEIHDIFVAARFVNLTVAMDAQVERHPVLEQRFVERREEHVAVPAKALDRYGEESVILAGIAAHDGGVAVTAGPVGRKQLPFEGILEIHELGLVELQICHFTEKL